MQRLLDRWNLLSPVTAWQQVIWWKCDFGNTGSEKPAGEPFNFTVSIKAVLIIQGNLLCYPETTCSCRIILWVLNVFGWIWKTACYSAEESCPQYQNPLFSEGGCDTLVFGFSKKCCAWDHYETALLSFFLFLF